MKRYDKAAFTVGLLHLLAIILFLYLLLKMSGHPMVSGDELMNETQAQKEARGREVITMATYAMGTIGMLWLYGMYNLGLAFKTQQNTGLRWLAALLLVAPLLVPIVVFLAVQVLFK